MPKISKRTHRLVLRDLSKTKIKLKTCKRIAEKLKKVIYKNNSTYKLNEQVCSKCLGMGTVLKTKKNIRYSIVCKECQTNNI